MKKRDTLFEKKLDHLEPFQFTGEVAEVFDDMASRSIPCYNDMQSIVARLALTFYQEGSKLYDVGCSTGNTIRAIVSLAERVAGYNKPKIVAVDTSREMLAIAQKKCDGMVAEWLCQGVEDMLFLDASVIIAVYVLQFIDTRARQAIVAKMYKGLRPGGILLFAEKVMSCNKQIESEITALYNNFKRDRGYSDTEITQKAESLKGILVPLSLEENIGMLKNAGFSSIELILKYLNFSCIMAIK